MQFEEFKKHMREIFDNGRFRLFLGKDRTLFTEAVNKAVCYIEKRIKDEQVSKEFEEDVVTSAKSVATRFMNKYLTENFVYPEVREFGKNLSLLLHNLSQATGVRELSDRAVAVSNLVNLETSVQGAISALRILVNYARQFDSFNPPAFQVNKYFLESIYNTLKKEDDKNESNN